MTAPVDERPGPDQAAPASPGGWLFWSAVAIGWAGIAYGVRGLLGEPVRAPNPMRFGRFGGTLLVAHDLLVAPLACALGVVIARVVPGRLRAPVQGGLIASALVTALAWPYLGGYGRSPSNPSALPWNYAHSLLIALAVVWVGAGIAAVVAWRRHEGRGPERSAA